MKLKGHETEKLNNIIRAFGKATWDDVASAATVSQNDGHLRQRKHAGLLKDLFLAFTR